jgi:hypothetical protein
VEAEFSAGELERIWNKIPTKGNNRHSNFFGLIPHAKVPDRKALLDSYFSIRFPDTKAIRNGYGTDIDRARERLTSDLKQHLDSKVMGQLFGKLLSENPPGPCEVVCTTRRNFEKWGNEEWFDKSEFASNRSEVAFSSATLVAIFDENTRELCPSNPKVDSAMKALAFHPLPASILAQNHQLEMHQKRIDAHSAVLEREKAAKALGKIAHGIGWIDEKSRVRLEDIASKEARDARHQIDSERDSVAGFWSNNALYGMILGKLLVRKLPPERKNAASEKWESSVDKVFQRLSKDFRKHISETGSGNSFFSNYALGLTTLTDPKPDPAILATMDGVAKDQQGKCTIPYSLNGDPGSEDEGSNVYRSIGWYYGLWKHSKSDADRKRHRESLVACLRRLPTEPFGPLSALRRHGTHQGPRNFAPYYFWGSMFIAMNAIAELKADKKPDAEPEDLGFVRKYIEQQISGNAFDKAKGLFEDKGSETYTTLPAYLNPLYGLALVHSCREERNLPFRSIF